ncbi:hypothetical protein BT96DRAFT_994923 [Gymnopus androsaceus JB14]|uniref:Uncharacterized protein n=1 Tax=Gymnopus androsaceus JB14 TaxID=1447944 RepID=A0A6A4HI28_9AGAR|nr:hypothetical protein BT96DRAFT_994923 [Gymnopus androsaceus JB14]
MLKQSNLPVKEPLFSTLGDPETLRTRLKLPLPTPNAPVRSVLKSFAALALSMTPIVPPSLPTLLPTCSGEGNVLLVSTVDAVHSSADHSIMTRAKRSVLDVFFEKYRQCWDTVTAAFGDVAGSNSDTQTQTAASNTASSQTATATQGTAQTGTTGSASQMGPTDTNTDTAAQTGTTGSASQTGTTGSASSQATGTSASNTGTVSSDSGSVSNMGTGKARSKKYERGDLVDSEWLDKLTFRKMEEIHAAELRNPRIYIFTLTCHDSTFRAPQTPIQPSANSFASDNTHLWSIIDPEVTRENPVDDKHWRLVRSHRSGPYDRELKPNAKDRIKIGVEILNYTPSQLLSPEEKDLIWKFRFHLARDKRGLNQISSKPLRGETLQKLNKPLKSWPQWTEIDTDDAWNYWIQDSNDDELTVIHSCNGSSTKLRAPPQAALKLAQAALKTGTTSVSSPTSHMALNSDTTSVLPATSMTALDTSSLTSTTASDTSIPTSTSATASAFSPVHHSSDHFRPHPFLSCPLRSHLPLLWIRRQLRTVPQLIFPPRAQLTLLRRLPPFCHLALDFTSNFIATDSLPFPISSLSPATSDSTSPMAATAISDLSSPTTTSDSLSLSPPFSISSSSTATSDSSSPTTTSDSLSLLFSILSSSTATSDSSSITISPLPTGIYLTQLTLLVLDPMHASLIKTVFWSTLLLCGSFVAGIPG